MQTQINPEQLLQTGSGMDGVVIAMLAAYLVQKLKTSKSAFTNWVTPESARMFSAIVATISAAGMTLSYDATSGTLLATGLTATGIAKFIWIAVKQGFLQDLIFRTGFALPDAVKLMAADRAGEFSSKPGPPSDIHI